jgi:hypothetical protein
MCKEGRKISGMPVDETCQSDAANRCSRQDSGYKVVACYPEGREDHRPLRVFGHTPEGLREAIAYANELATDCCRRSDLDNRYQVDDCDFDPVVYEFCTQLKEMCRPVANTEETASNVAESVADGQAGKTHDAPADSDDGKRGIPI